MNAGGSASHAARRTDSARRQAILVLGMHRSGTSALTRCLNLLGADLGTNLMPPVSGNNQMGFWEDAEVVQIHEALLAALGHNWCDARALPDGWLYTEAAQAARARLVDLLDREFANAALWAVKDPRMCRFVPLWREVCEQLHVALHAVLVVRHPAEVARSLYARDRLPFEIVNLCWLEHLASAEAETREVPRSLVTYDQLLADWQGTLTRVGADLGVRWPVGVDVAKPAIEAFLKREEKHQVGSDAAVKVPEVLQDLYRICGTCAPGPDAWKRMAALVDNYRLISPPFVQHADRLVNELRKLGRRVARGVSLTDDSAAGVPVAGPAVSLSGDDRTVPGDHTALYFRAADEPFSEERVCVQPIDWQTGLAKVLFEVPAGIRVQSVRFDPSCFEGAFDVYGLYLNGRPVHELDTRVRDVHERRLHLAGEAGVWFVALDDDPRIEFEIGDLVRDAASLIVEIRCRRSHVDRVSGALMGSLNQELKHSLQATLAKPVTALSRQLALILDAIRDNEARLNAALESSRAEASGLQARVNDLEGTAAQLNAALESSRSNAVNLQARIDALENDRRRLEGDLGVSRAGLEQAGKREAELLEAWSRQRNQLACAEEREAAVQRALNNRSAELANTSRVLAGKTSELATIKNSVGWRAVVGLSSVLMVLPAWARKGLRRTCKAAWWILTPQRMLARIRFLRARKLQQLGVPRPDPNRATVVPSGAGEVSPQQVASGMAGAALVKATESASTVSAAAHIRSDTRLEEPFVQGSPATIQFRPQDNSGAGMTQTATASKTGRYALAAPSADYTYVPLRPPERLGAAIAGLQRKPRFSILVPVYNTPEDLLQRLLASVQAQWYPYWQLILVDDNSSEPQIRAQLDAITDTRVVVAHLDMNHGISGATNEAIAMADGDFIVFLDHDDELTTDCLYELALRIDQDDPDFIYSDEDKIDVNGRFVQPFFKPDWSPDTMMSTMYTCHVSCMRRTLVKQVGGLHSAFDGCQDWDLVLRLTEQAKRIVHIPKVLYHWRVIPASVASSLDAKPGAVDASRRVREQALQRRGLCGALVPVPEIPGHFRVRYDLRGQPLVSIVIPSKNNGAVLKRCLDSIFGKTAYRHFEILVLDNGSTDPATLDYFKALQGRDQTRVLVHDAPFNYSELNNLGAANTQGDILLFLNDDTEVLSGDWLAWMAGYAQLPHVGAVGAKLLYPADRTVQHAGVVNLAEGPGHAFLRAPSRAPCYFARNLLEYDWLAVTGACLMVERSKFDLVHGFDEELPVAYNDVAFCFSLAEQGLYQVACPGIELLHYESLTRGSDTADSQKLARLERDKALLYAKHPGFYMHDPFHNPNLAPNDVQFGIAR